MSFQTILRLIALGFAIFVLAEGRRKGFKFTEMPLGILALLLAIISLAI